MSLPYLEVRVPRVPHVPPQGAQMRKLAVNQMTWCHPSSDLLYTVFVFSVMGEFETGLCIWNHITISTVHHVIPYKCKALLSSPIIVVRIFNFAVADVAQHADSIGQTKKRRKLNEERESSTTGTNCNTDGNKFTSSRSSDNSHAHAQHNSILLNGVWIKNEFPTAHDKFGVWIKNKFPTNQKRIPNGAW